MPFSDVCKPIFFLFFFFLVKAPHLRKSLFLSAWSQICSAVGHVGSGKAAAGPSQGIKLGHLRLATGWWGGHLAPRSHLHP